MVKTEGVLQYAESKNFADKYKYKGIIFGVVALVLTFLGFFWGGRCVLMGEKYVTTFRVILYFGVLIICGLIGMLLILDAYSITRFRMYSKGIVIPKKSIKELFMTGGKEIFLPYTEVMKAELFSRTAVKDIKDACLLTTRGGKQYVISDGNVENFQRFIELIKDKISFTYLQKKAIKNPLERLFKER